MQYNRKDVYIAQASCKDSMCVVTHLKVLKVKLLVYHYLVVCVSKSSKYMTFMLGAHTRMRENVFGSMFGHVRAGAAQRSDYQLKRDR